MGDPKCADRLGIAGDYRPLLNPFLPVSASVSLFWRFPYECHCGTCEMVAHQAWGNPGEMTVLALPVTIVHC